MVRLIAFVGFMLGTAALAFAGSPVAATPEIDLSAGATAIALLSGAVLVLRSRRKR